MMCHDDRHLVGSAPARPVTVVFRSISEAAPGAKWQRIFRHGWPGWSDWLGDRAGDDAAELRRAERALRRHMPEFVPVWERLVELAGGGPRAARFLTFWSPPRYLLNCAQAVVVGGDGPVLVRNYDLDPALNEGRLFSSAWQGRGVIGMVEGLAGLADGMNDAGLAVSLAFGGRPNVGRGFGVPLILRYLLQVCADVPDAVEALRGLPCHMSYNLTLLDRQGQHATVLLAPDRPPIVTPATSVTNHQLGVEWPRHGRLSRTVERAAFLAGELDRGQLDGDGLLRLFLAPPLHSRGYGSGFGTVYTAAYRPAAGRIQLAWPGGQPWAQGFGDFTEGHRAITFADGKTPSERPPVKAVPIRADRDGPGGRRDHRRTAPAQGKDDP
jgi:predicted choloylglycine hydrolase